MLLGSRYKRTKNRYTSLTLQLLKPNICQNEAITSWAYVVFSIPARKPLGNYYCSALQKVYGD